MNRLYATILAIPLAFSCKGVASYLENRLAPTQGEVEVGIPTTNVCSMNSIHGAMLDLYDILNGEIDDSDAVSLPAINRVYSQAEAELDHHDDALKECFRLVGLRQPVKARMRYQAAEYHAWGAALWMTEAVIRINERDL